MRKRRRFGNDDRLLPKQPGNRELRGRRTRVLRNRMQFATAQQITLSDRRVGDDRDSMRPTSSISGGSGWLT